MKADREQLKAWYRQAMSRRAEELRALRDGLASGNASSCDAARAVGQALRGSGATFGFPELSAAAGLVESSADEDAARRVEGLIEQLDRLGVERDGGPAVHAEWLALAAGLGHAGVKPHTDIAGAWRDAAERSGLSSTQLAERAARRLDLRAADLTVAGRAALRLVPEALMRRELLLPLAEDTETIRVATADPTSLATELELMRLTGRRPVFEIAPPEALAHALSALLDVAPEPAPRRRVAPLAAGGQTTVLVVDDDGSSRLLARTVLEKQGYAVLEAADGAQALLRLRDAPAVGLVVADLNMPEMDGLELLWEMRSDARLSHVPVIVLTGAKDEILETKLIEEGADDYLCKPLDPRLFLARVAATIRRIEA